MLFGADRWQTYTADPERTYRALTAPGATTLVAIDKGVVAGQRDALARAGGLRIDGRSRSGSNDLSLGTESVPGFRLHKETMA
jgi:hypothetical protein